MSAARQCGLSVNRLAAALAAVVSLAAALGACTSPPPRLYTVAAMPGPTHSGAPKVIVLREVSLAPYLQQPPIVRSAAGYRLAVMSNDWWGEPPAAMLTRILVDNLTQRLPGSTVLGESGAVAAPADATLEVNISRLDEAADGQLVLQAQAAVDTKARKEPQPRNFRFAVIPSSPDVYGEVAAISTAVGQLSDALASMLANR